VCYHIPHLETDATNLNEQRNKKQAFEEAHQPNNLAERQLLLAKLNIRLPETLL
jgi:hypothetical protein